MKLIYATDLDRTLIFSKRFISEYKPHCDYSIVETKGDKVISYMANSVIDELHKLTESEDIMVIPVTTRSLDEYNRVKLNFKPKYAIVANGGIILEDGKPMQAWEEYINDNVNKLDLMNASMDLEDLCSVGRDTKIIDGRYIFNKTHDEQEFDSEILYLMDKYPDIQFTRQVKKVYGIPKCFSKAVALRWLQNYLKASTIVASGDSEMDLPMLAIADYAMIPEHGALVKDGIVLDGRILKAGIESPLETIKLVKSLLDDKSA